MRTAFFALTILLTTGCSALSAAAPPPSSTPAATATATAASAAYTLGPGDKLRITVFGEQNLSGDYQVSGAGNVSMPLIGDVRAAGMSAPAFTEAVRAKLADGYLRDPKVSMEVLSYRPYYMLGEIGRPAEYTYTNDLTVMNAIATAGGFSYRADRKWVFIRHQGANKEVRVRLTATTLVEPGDTLRIRERLF